MDQFWAYCSVPDLLTLTLLSQSASRDARRQILTMDRLIELWQGGPWLPAVLLDSSCCTDAFTASEDHTWLDQRPATGERAARILGEGVQWILRTRLSLPRNHVLLRFFTPGHECGVQVCNVRLLASPPDMEHYVLRCCSLDAASDVFLHLTLYSSSSTREVAWQPGPQGRLLGSMPWQVANNLQRCSPEPVAAGPVERPKSTGPGPPRVNERDVTAGYSVGCA